MNLAKITPSNLRAVIEGEPFDLRFRHFDDIYRWVREGWYILDIGDDDWFTRRGLGNSTMQIKYSLGHDDEFQDRFMECYGQVRSVNLIITGRSTNHLEQAITAIIPFGHRMKIRVVAIKMNRSVFGLKPPPPPPK